MKVKIFTEGGKDIGYGHLSRCIALYEEIQNRGIRVELIIYGDIEDIGLLEDKPIINVNWIDLDYLDKSLNDNDYAIVDSYIGAQEHYEKIAFKSKKLLCIDDIGRIRYPKALIVNPALGSEGIDYSYLSKNLILRGSEYIIIRSAFTQINRTRIQGTVSRVLIIMGGTDVKGISSLIIEKICKHKPEIIFDIVVSADQYERISSLYKAANIHLHKNLSEFEMSQIMIYSDLALSAAGQTIYELIATQTPFIAIQVAENQENNMDSLLKHIPSQIVLKYGEKDFIEELENKFSELLNYKNRKKTSQEMKGLIDGKGKKRIIDALLSDINMMAEIHLRKAHKEDIRDVFELSNKDYVREHSINKKKISWNDHIKWFSDVLSDNEVVFYVITDKENTFLGQIRYNIKKNNALVSISLSEEIKGKGFSQMVLDQSIDKLFKEKTNINRVIAYVSENNIASMKIFKGLKFKVIDQDNSLVKLGLRRNEYYGN